MKIFTCSQIKEIDIETILKEPVSSIDLMERAAERLCDWIISNIDKVTPVAVFAGPGNNGGDGLAVARLLSNSGYILNVYFAGNENEFSADWQINRTRLINETSVLLTKIEEISEFPELPEGTVIIDALFGSGLSRPVSGLFSGIIGKINASDLAIVAIDIPSGLFGEDNAGNDIKSIIRADFTLTLQFPKLSFFFAENEAYTGKVVVIPIGLNQSAIENSDTPFRLTENEDINLYVKPRKKFSHKGNYGHGLLIGGSEGKMGAVILGARAAMKSGIGLLTCHIPSGGNLIMQCAVPEAMTICDASEKCISSIGEIKKFNAIAIGPGIGKDPFTVTALESLLEVSEHPLVIDADALNILADNRDWFSLIPAGSILTPHPGEFERLTGMRVSGYDRLMLQIDLSRKTNSIVVLKGAYTSISEPGGNVWFNSSGNPGMATAGSGDTLTGIILSLLAQGHDPIKAAITGVYLHGLAGDIACCRLSEESLTASDIIDNLGNAFKEVSA